MKSFRILFLAVMLPIAASCNRTSPEVSWTSSIGHTLWRGERCGLIAKLDSDTGISSLKADIIGIPFAEARFLTYVTGDILEEKIQPVRLEEEQEGVGFPACSRPHRE